MIFIPENHYSECFFVLSDWKGIKLFSSLFLPIGYFPTLCVLHCILWNLFRLEVQTKRLPICFDIALCILHTGLMQIPPPDTPQ